MLIRIVSVKDEQIEVKNISSEELHIKTPLARVRVILIVRDAVFRLYISDFQTINHISTSRNYCIPEIHVLTYLVKRLRMFSTIFQCDLTLRYIQCDFMTFNIKLASTWHLFLNRLTAKHECADTGRDFNTIRLACLHYRMKGSTDTCVIIANEFLRYAVNNGLFGYLVVKL